MKRFVVFVLLALALAPAATTSAAPPTNVNGTFDLVEIKSITGTPLGPDGPCLVNIDGVYAFKGDIEGSGPATLRIVVQTSCEDQSPPFTYHENGQIQGTLNNVTIGDRTGSFDFSWNFLVRHNVASGRLVIQHGTGGLAGLHGVLETRADQTPEPATYTGRIHFAP